MPTSCKEEESKEIEEQEEVFEARRFFLNRFVRDNPFIPDVPTQKQAEFLTCMKRKSLFGGSAGSAKSRAQLQAALMFAEFPQYNAILFRRTYPQLDADESLIDQSEEMLGGSDAEWNESKSLWTFPSGATLRFSHMQHEDDRFSHKSAAYHFIGFDEATEFEPSQLRYLFSRLRKKGDDPIPLRFRLTSNPGGPAHEYVKQNYIDNPDEDTEFIPAQLEDNPHLDTESYEDSLSELRPIERKRLREGDWEVQPSGDMFKREWFTITQSAPRMKRVVRSWDLAGTESDDASFTVGVLYGESVREKIIVLDVKYFKKSPGKRDQIIVETSKEDGANVTQVLEQEPGSGGKKQCQALKSRMKGSRVEIINPTGSKETRAGPLRSTAETDTLHLVQSDWNSTYKDKVVAFPEAGQDFVDATAQAHNFLFVDEEDSNQNKNWIIG